MRNFIDRVLRFLNISGRDWAVFLLALLLAFSIWLIHNLSLKYTEFMQASVEAVCNIEGHNPVSSNKCDVLARCQTTGYGILRNSMYSRGRKVTVKFDPSVMKNKSGEVFYVVLSDLKESAHMIFGDEVQLEYFITDTLFFRFPYENHKRVPVNPVRLFTFQSQYTPGGALKIEPDSVTIYGEPLHIDGIDAVNTEVIKHSDIKTSIQGMTRLEKIKGVRMSEDMVHYSLPVSRFVDIPVTVTVQARNVPPGKSLMIYPSTADVELRCAFPITADLSESVRFFIDYHDFVSSTGGKCTAQVASLPQGVLGYRIEPKVFECVMRDLQ